MKNKMLFVFSLFSVICAWSQTASAQGNDIRIGRSGFAYNAETNESFLTVCMKPTPSQLDPGAMVANCVCIIHNEISNRTTWRKLSGENDRCESQDAPGNDMAEQTLSTHPAES